MVITLNHKHDLNLRLGDNAQLLTVLSAMEHRIMATLADIKADIQSAKDAIAAEKVEVHAQLDALGAQITALTDAIAAGTAVTAADLDGLHASLQEIVASVSDITVPEVPA